MGVKISNLPAIVTPAMTDVFPVVQAGVTYKETVTQLLTLLTPIPLANGGTGAALTASNGGIFYSTATTGAILSGTATAGLALLSGASAAPTWSTLPPITKIATQTITATGAFTYTATTGTKYAIFELQAAGGGSGGTTGTAGQGAVGAGGGGGAYQKILVSGASNLAAITGTVGVGGVAGAAGNNNGAAGGNTTLVINSGSTWTSAGGGGGNGQASNAATQQNGDGVGGTNTSGTNGTLIIGIGGGYSQMGFISAAGAFPSIASAGGTACLSNTIRNSPLPVAGKLYGGGASGGSNGSGADQAGEAGANGVVIITEYISI